MAYRFVRLVLELLSFVPRRKEYFVEVYFEIFDDAF
jgi:hypothetical protein